MYAREHISLGAATGALIGFTLFGKSMNSVLFGSMCTIGSAFPDIDLPASYVGSIFKPVTRTVNRLFGHRGFVHSPVCLVLCSLILYLLCLVGSSERASVVAVGFGLGFCIHLLQDMVTLRGIPIFWPWMYRVHLTNFKSGHFMCSLITAAMFVFVYAITRKAPWYISNVWMTLSNALTKIADLATGNSKITSIVFLLPFLFQN